MAVPLHTLIKLTPRAYGTQEERYSANIPAVSTWRAKGSVAKHEDPETNIICLGGATAEVKGAEGTKADVAGEKKIESTMADLSVTNGKENDAPEAEAADVIALKSDATKVHAIEVDATEADTTDG